mgnify:CR=1 FL=1
MGRLEDLRNAVDAIDKKLIQLLLLRFRVVKQIALYKKANRMEQRDKKREYQVLKNAETFSGKHKYFIIDIFKKILDYSRKIQLK